MSTVVALLGLAAVHWLAVMSPGPSTVLVVQTAAVSRRGGLIAAFAMMLGALLWAAAALYGLQALFAQFAWLYRVFQVAGGAFLIYLAVQIWRHAREPLPEIAPAAARVGDGQIFARALLLQLGNPKIMVFFGSIFLSVLPHDMPAWLQAVVLALVAFDEFTWFAVLALTFSGTTARAFYRRAKFWLDRFMGGALALLGLRLALSSR
ncbi:MAG TPA: LysE family translocator [Reyranella sp.]|nr:LysE family translocator [Reyranella sp.]